MIDPDKRKLVHQKIFYFLILAIVFFIPVYGRILPTLIVLLLLNWLIEGSYIKTIPLLFKERKRLELLSFSLLYLLYLIGLSYSSNLKYGGFDVEVKLSLFLFPFIFATSEPFYLQKEKSTTLLFSFIAGCLTSTLLLYGHAAYSMVADQSNNAFYYEKLSWYFHPSYLAMYLTFAIAILAYWLMEGYHVFNRYQLYGTLMLIIYFFVFIVLLNSKAGLISLFMVIFFYSVALVLLKHNWLLGTATLFLTVLSFFICLSLFPYSGERLKQAGKDLQSADSHEKNPKSTAERIEIWNCSLEIIREHALFGVGTGDVKDALMERYKANDLTKVLRLKLNAHNQYLQTLLSLGIFGLLTLVSMLVFPAIQALRRKYFIYFLFLAIFAVNIMLESMLEIQAGVVFYALFNALLFISDRPDPSGNPFDILVRQV
jgi:O-antigen ligase